MTEISPTLEAQLEASNANEERRLAIEERDLALRELNSEVQNRVKWAECVSKLPGSTVDDIRAAAGLGPHPHGQEIGSIAFNLPPDGA